MSILPSETDPVKSTDNPVMSTISDRNESPRRVLVKLVVAAEAMTQFVAPDFDGPPALETLRTLRQAIYEAQNWLAAEEVAE